MAKLTVSEIKKQIAALEAKASRLAKEESEASVGKVHALMNQLGVTLEHLSSAVTRKVKSVKNAVVATKPTGKRAGKGIVKYRDPATGATWTGFGRAPGWIAGVADRDAFLVGAKAKRAVQTATKPAAAKKKIVKNTGAAEEVSAKKVGAKKAVALTKKVASKAVLPAVPKRRPSIKAAASKAAAKKAARSKSASDKAEIAPPAVESSGNATK